MDAILKNQAEKFAREMAGQATTLEDLNGPGLPRCQLHHNLFRV